VTIDARFLVEKLLKLLLSVNPGSVDLSMPESKLCEFSLYFSVA